MPNNEGDLACKIRMIAAPDGAELPVPCGGIGGVRNANGTEVWIRDDAQIQVSLFGAGYYVVINNTEPENNEATELFYDLTAEAIQEAAERVLLRGAPFLLEGVLWAGGVLASVLTTSKLTCEIFIRGEYNGVTITYCILA